MTESRRALLRIVSNLARLFGSVIIGLLLIRALLRAVGPDGVGLISLLANSVGLASALEESVENSLVRELGRAHHSGDEGEFKRVYNSSLVVSAAAAACSAVLYLLIACILPLLSIREDLLSAARWFIVAKAIESMTIIALSPAYNMYLVRERMIALNMWMLARRACGLAAAVITLLLRPATPAEGLILFAFIAGGMLVCLLLAAVAVAVIGDRRLRPSLRYVDRRTCGEIVRSSGTNASIYLTQLLQIPACAIVMNLAFGLRGNLIFGLGVQCAGYVRMLAIGFAVGIEAVAARLSSDVLHASPQSHLKALAYHATRLQGFVTVAAAAGMFIIAPSFIRVWLSGDDSVDAHALEQMSILARVLVVGVAAQAVLDVWWRVLYGAGLVRHYARPFAVVAILTVPLGVLLLQTLPESARYVGPSVAYSGLSLALALLILPPVVARCFDVERGQLLLLLGRPVVPALVASAVAWLVDRAWQPPGFLSLIAVGTAFAIVFAITAWPMVLESRDRDRLMALLRRAARPRV